MSYNASADTAVSIFSTTTPKIVTIISAETYEKP
jgi:hypothetical protein